MADQEPEKKTYIVIHRDSIEWLQEEVNKKLDDWYSLYWELQCLEKIYMQAMMLTKKIPALKVTATSTVTSIWWTVNVSWCWGGD